MVLALIAIVGAVLFGVGLGMWFSLVMIGVAGAAILYDTSNIIRVYPSDRYVAGALQPFASVALMFWYALVLPRRATPATSVRPEIGSSLRYRPESPAVRWARRRASSSSMSGRTTSLLELGERPLVVVGERAELRRAALGELHLREDLVAPREQRRPSTFELGDAPGDELGAGDVARRLGRHLLVARVEPAAIRRSSRRPRA